MGDKVSDAPEIDYVAKARFWKCAFKKEQKIQNQEWPYKNGDAVDVYKEMYRKLEEGGTEQQLPNHGITVVDDFLPYEPQPEDVRCLPETSYGEYGWKVGNSPVMPTYRWTRSAGLSFMHKQLGWPEDHQW
ncbi:uncharacterized protein LOC106012484 [Aplysia californica]|uniref:Uncharacterized protein LOC106012484 n=1 Tax=Aplysia californica TaxID=6500 RepID=A0ABM1A550_APLCA|nr:uncharacterized protein LOC106012484 [Aplysia californica]